MDYKDLIVKFLGSDVFANIIALLGLIPSKLGGDSVKNRVFFVQLKTRLVRLEKILKQTRIVRIRDEEFNTPFNCGLYALSTNRNFSNIKDNDEKYKEDIRKIQGVSEELLSFLSTSENPPLSKDEQKREKWKGYIDELIEKLTDLEQIGCGYTIQNLDISDQLKECESSGENFEENKGREILNKQIEQVFLNPLLKTINDIKEWIDEA